MLGSAREAEIIPLTRTTQLKSDDFMNHHIHLQGGYKWGYHFEKKQGQESDYDLNRVVP